MIRSGLRRVASKVKRRIRNRLHPEPPVRGGTVSAPVHAASVRSDVATPATSTQPEPAGSATTASSAAPVPDGSDVTSTSPAGSTAQDAEHPPLTREIVWDLFEDMVRPALQADGGDIELVNVEDNDVYVRLVGACRSCPSSTITMRQGIERLLREEFPQFGHLIQVDAGPGHEAAMAAAAP